jgi:tRNA threonylcarbamoyladenosine biosynthesis protein TsaE
MKSSAEIACRDLTELERAAELLLTSFPKNTIFAFYGAMGVGKTTYIQHICKVLGVMDDVTSPTFNIVNEYRRLDGGRVFHMDFYRINNIAEVLDIGYEEYFYSGEYCFIEWPEKVEKLLPEVCVRVLMEELATDHSRRIKFQVH